MKRWVNLIAALVIAMLLAACASEGVTRAMSGPPRLQTDVFPGNFDTYSMGEFQTQENFLNVQRAQVAIPLLVTGRSWADVTAEKRPSGNLGNLRSYLKFDMRWKLKDGREFILENIDVRSYSMAYLNKNPLQLQWQRENRQQSKFGGDFDPLLTYEVKDDAVLLKWVVRINYTPVNARFTQAGAATRWDVQYEEYIFATIPGKPTSGIDFNKKYDPR